MAINKTNKKKYKIRNWSEYNNNLKQRGSMTLWISDDVVNKWEAKSLAVNSRGAQPVYSDFAIQIVLQLGKVFHQKLRQTEGLLTSVFKLMNLSLSVPDYSTISRRSTTLNILLAKKEKKKEEKLVVVIDSTGLKVYGEGEWKVRQHGVSKRRTWRKAHLVVTPDGEIRAAELTTNDVADCEVFDNLLNQEKQEIETIAGDGGYDKGSVYESCKQRKIPNVLIPPQKNARIKHHGNLKAEPYSRDENLRQIRKVGRKDWKIASGYHIRSLAETAMFRLKTILGDKLNFRKFKNQVSEFMISISILNKMSSLGMPDSYIVD